MIFPAKLPSSIAFGWLVFIATVDDSSSLQIDDGNDGRSFFFPKNVDVDFWNGIIPHNM